LVFGQLLRLAEYGSARRVFVGQEGILRAGWQPNATKFSQW
jgi:hypothetical protein